MWFICMLVSLGMQERQIYGREYEKSWGKIEENGMYPTLQIIFLFSMFLEPYVMPSVDANFDLLVAAV